MLQGATTHEATPYWRLIHRQGPDQPLNT